MKWSTAVPERSSGRHWRRRASHLVVRPAAVGDAAVPPPLCLVWLWGDGERLQRDAMNGASHPTKAGLVIIPRLQVARTGS